MQRNGHCTVLLQSVYDDLVPNNSILDITGKNNNLILVSGLVFL